MHGCIQFRLCSCIALLLLCAPLGAFASDKVQFNRDIRPILADTCFKCHGFDAKARKADLRLDTSAGATVELEDGARPIVPGHPELSEAIRRLTTDDPEDKMPPVKSGLTWTKPQIELFKRWIAQGAEFQPHWSLIKPVEPSQPEVKDLDWPKNGIDRFILARLEEERLKPNPEADRPTLIRRVTLDLTGLPPTPAEVDAFVQDPDPDAYEKVVDRLLASPRYGERMALRWLDLARYADTNGYQNDTERAQWPWRDWVINSFNANQPFDQFTVEQLAGDLLPNATLEQKVASSFNRNHRITLEGGVIPEEYRTEYVMDRVETTATVWLALTIGCCRCHDHKYDPITQAEYYKFFAFFNNVPENGIDGRDYNSTPFIPVPPRGEPRIKLASLQKNADTAEAAMKAIEPQLAAAQAKWEETLRADDPLPTLRDGLVTHLPLDGNTIDAAAPCRGGDFRNGEAAFSPGLLDEAADFDGKRIIDLGDIDRFERDQPYSLAAWVFPTDETDGAIIARMDEKKGEIGYNLYWQKGLVHFQMMHHVPDNMITLVSQQPQPASMWHHVAATYDGSGKAAGCKIFLDGKRLPTNVGVDNLKASIVATRAPLQIGARFGGSPYAGKIDDVRIYNRAFSPAEVENLGGIKVMATHVAPDQRKPEQVAAVRRFYIDTAATQEQKDAIARIDATKADLKKFLDATPTVMVMSESKPRDTFILKRGQYDQPGDKVTADTPSCLPPPPKEQKLDRLALGKWLIDPSNPLTSRVAVNRFWEMYFGTGIVKSSEDFGTQSEWPSHPELLDWLAVNFVRSKWDVKAMQKLIVTSATYRQGSKVTPALLEKDPANRLLARGPRLRLSGETIRDQALSISGLLVEKIGGPSVRPYQPPRIWEELTTGAAPGLTGQVYVQDHDEALYRRSMYSFWKRTVPLPTLTTFDAPSREICVVRRSRTNTPLQALCLLNDTIYAEASRKLAERAINEGGEKPSERISHAFELAVARKPKDTELKILVDDFNAHLATYFSDPDAANKVVAIGESKRNPNLDPRELAAYTAVSSVILNMDQTITRE